MTAARSGWFDLRQTWTLTCRYLDLLRSDRLNLAVLLLQAPLIALVVGGIFDTAGTQLERAQTQSRIAFVLVLSATDDKAIAALPLLLIPQFILSNAVVPLSGVALAFAKVAVIAYWALDALHATLEPSVRALRAPDGSAIISVNGD